MKLNISFSCSKACFVYRITQKIFDILCVILGNSWICILNCVSCFVSIILNFNAFCDECTVQIQTYTVLLESSRIFWLILVVIFGNFILAVSEEGDDHLLLYFGYFLNYPPLYEEIDC